MTDSDSAVLEAMRQSADQEGAVIIPRADLAVKANVPLGTAKRAIDRLVAAGLIERRIKRGEPNAYVLVGRAVEQNKRIGEPGGEPGEPGSERENGVGSPAPTPSDQIRSDQILESVKQNQIPGIRSDQGVGSPAPGAPGLRLSDVERLFGPVQYRTRVASDVERLNGAVGGAVALRFVEALHLGSGGEWVHSGRWLHLARAWARAGMPDVVSLGALDVSPASEAAGLSWSDRWMVGWRAARDGLPAPEGGAERHGYRCFSRFHGE